MPPTRNERGDGAAAVTVRRRGRGGAAARRFAIQLSANGSLIARMSGGANGTWGMTAQEQVTRIWRRTDSTPFEAVLQMSSANSHGIVWERVDGLGDRQEGAEGRATFPMTSDALLEMFRQHEDLAFVPGSGENAARVHGAWGFGKRGLSCWIKLLEPLGVSRRGWTPVSQRHFHGDTTGTAISAAAAAASDSNEMQQPQPQPQQENATEPGHPDADSDDVPPSDDE